MSTEEKLEAATDSEKDVGSLVEDLHSNQLWAKTRWRQQLLRWGVEERGVYSVRVNQSLPSLP